ncbi:MAG: hypothetical protein HQ570_00675 [Candidatus Omnitrophica bacterium]|nr:hypothetical protein [Candidatus Omnitrophota bacterium]
MRNNFNPQEIVKIAISIEENGKELYEALEDKARDKKLKTTCKYLKEQEEFHRKLFQEMLDNIEEYIVYEFSQGEYEAYLRAIATEYIFTQEIIRGKIKEGFRSDLVAVEFGIFIEKESILTYSALGEYMLAGRQAVLRKIIDEEKKHLIDLIAIKDSLKQEG